ncbi:MAG: DUF2723 domain-containing protein [Gemmatimonadaceae bacterium]
MTASAAQLDYRPSYKAAAIASTLVFLLYLVTLSPSTAMWDTSEYIAAAYILGIPHPPGNPLFVLIGRVFAIMPIAPNVAMRINIFAALCSAVSAGMWFLVTERVLVSWLPRRWQRIAGGSLAALIGATAFTVWSQSVVNEKVYTLSLVGMAISAWLIVRWCDDPDGPKADKLLILIAYISGLGYANHMAGFLVLPPLAIAVLIRRPQTILRWRLILAGVAAILLGMTPYATQPIRAAFFPAINEGEPTACESKMAAACTFDKVTYQRFKYNFDREQYGKPSLTERQAPFSAQVGMWWLYFKWQWVRDHMGERPGIQTLFATIFLLLGGLGGYVHWRRDRNSFWFFGPLVFTVTFGLIYYMNFKYGFSQAPELGDAVPREVRDRDYFYLWSFSTWSVWAALGLVYVWETLAALAGADDVRLGNETVTVPKQRSWLAASPVLALALIPLLANWSSASRAGQTDTRDFAADLLNSVEPYGILVTAGDNDTFPLWYAQEVEGIRRDVLVANTSLLNTEWYTRQMIRRPTFEYDVARGPEIYRGRAWPKPQDPPVKMTFKESDAVPLALELREPQIFRKEGTGIVARVEPRNIGYGVMGLARADIFVLYLIRDSYPQRPFYFSRTTGNYAEELGLGRMVVGTGLARKLVLAEPAPSDSLLWIPGEGWFDLPTSLAMWDSYAAPDEMIERGHWIDKSSVNIPYLYVRAGFILAQALIEAGRGADATRVYSEVVAIARASHLEDAIPSTPPPQLPEPIRGDTGPTP